MEQVLTRSQTHLWMRMAISAVLLVVFFTLAHLAQLSFWKATVAAQDSLEANEMMTSGFRLENERIPARKIALVERLLKVSLRKSHLTTAQVQQLVYWADTLEILETRRLSGWGINQPLKVTTETLPFSLLRKTQKIRTSRLASALRGLGRARYVAIDANREEYLHVFRQLTGPGLYYHQTRLDLGQIAFVYLAAEEELAPGPMDWLWSELKTRWPLSAKL